MMRRQIAKKLGGAVAAATLVTGLTIGVTASPAFAADADIAVTEVNPRGNDTPLGKDWVELTNLGTTTIDLTGWKVDDDSNSFASGLPITGVTSIAPGQSIILVTEGTATSPATFLSQWWGASPPAGLQVGYLPGSGLGLGNGGDQVNVFNAAGTRVANVSFGSTTAATPFPTFDNTVGNDGAIAVRSVSGTNGAFQSAQGAELGSPGIGNIGPTPVVPEFPLAPLAVVMGGALIGGWFVLRGRNQATTTLG